MRAILLMVMLLSWLPLAREGGVAGVTVDGLLSSAELQRLEEVRALFSAESEVMLVGVAGEQDAWSDDRIESLCSDLRDIPSVSRVDSLPDALWRQAGGSGELRILVALLDRDSLEIERARRINAAFRYALQRASMLGDKFHYVGTPRLRAESWGLARTDFLRLLPVLSVIALGIPWLLFRSWTSGLFLLLCAAGTSSLTLWCIRIIEGAIPAQVLLVLPVLWAAAAMDAMHLLARMTWPDPNRASDQPPTVRESLREIRRPCITTTVTTAAGLALIGAGGESELLVRLGLWAATGVILALALTYLLAPYFLSDREASSAAPQWPLQLGTRLGAWTRSHPRWILIGTLVASVCCLPLLRQLSITTRYPHLFAPQLELSQDMRAIADSIGSDMNPVQLLMRREEGGDEREIALLRSLFALEAQLTTLPEFAFMLPSPALVLAAQLSSQAAVGGSQVGSIVPSRGFLESLPGSDASAIEQLDQDRLAAWIDRAQGHARVQLHFRQISWGRKNAVLRQLEEFDRAMLSNHELVPWGSGFTTHRIEQLGLGDLLEGSAWTALAMFVILTLALRNLLTGLLALLASVWPMLFVAAAMGGLGIPWSIALLPLPGALLGIGVDDSIHMLWRPGQSRPEHARSRAFPAVLGTTLLLVLCVLSLRWTSMQANRDFGLLLAIGMSAALWIDVLVLPIIDPRRANGQRP
ncbi:MAG: putative RND superfamily exporter protein [Planctomycetota bacterium]|jgi:predicted RND superfamily exporter protein